MDLVAEVTSDTDNVLFNAVDFAPSLALNLRTTDAFVAGGAYVHELLTVAVPEPLHPAPRVPPPLITDQLQVIESPFGSNAEAVKVTLAVPVSTEEGTPILVITGAAGAVFILVLPFARSGYTYTVPDWVLSPQKLNLKEP